MSKTPQQVNLSWDTIHDAVECLAHQIKAMNPTRLVAISRGGLIPGTMISHLLQVPLSVISAQSYEGTRRTLDKSTEIVGWDLEYTKEEVVFIDDILDSGETYHAVRALYNKPLDKSLIRAPNYITLVNKLPHTFKTPFFIHVPKDVWVQFPWEK